MKEQKSKGVRGFTLVELIVVIVILGILGAYVTGRFTGIDTDAKVAVMRNFASSLKTSSEVVHGLAISRVGHTTASKQIINIGRTQVLTRKGYAVASEDGIVQLFKDVWFLDLNPVSRKAGKSFKEATKDMKPAEKAKYSAKLIKEARAEIEKGVKEGAKAKGFSAFSSSEDKKNAANKDIYAVSLNAHQITFFHGKATQDPLKCRVIYEYDNDGVDPRVLRDFSNCN